MSFPFDSEDIYHIYPYYEDNNFTSTDEQTSQDFFDSSYYLIEPPIQDLYLKKKRRKKNENPNRKPHSRYAIDNIKRKIQVHYLRFLINFINRIIYEIVYKDKNIKNFQFYPLSYKYTQNVTKDSFNLLKNSKIGDIFKNNVSPKFKDHENLNIDVYIEVTKNNIIKKILDKKYLEFVNIYYYSKKTFDLKNYDLNLTINLPDNLGYFQDLIQENDVIYTEKMKKCIENDFLPKSIFIIAKLKKNLQNV